MSQSEIDRLYRAYGFMIYGRCLRLLGSKEEARDAMQVVFMKLLQAYNTIHDKEKVVAWIFRAAQNHCFNLLRNRKKFATEVEAAELVDSQNSYESFTSRELIEKVLERFNDDIGAAVHYTFIEGLEQQEIQRLTGQSPATIRRNLKRFRDGLPGVVKRLGLHEV